MDNLTRIIREEIGKQYKSVRQFAFAVGVPLSTVNSALHNGVGGSSFDTVLRLCKVLGIKALGDDAAFYLTDDTEKLLKVKCSLYMITRALSQYNKLGDPDMQEFCRRQPDRIYQFQVEHDGQPDYIACYLRVKAGQSKSGHGVYTRRSPFVLFHFFSLDGALKVLGKECEFVEGVEKGYVETIGSPEYACYLNDYMAILQGMLT